MRNQSRRKAIKENNSNRLRHIPVYEPDFKKTVVSFAEEKGTSEAKKQFGVSESCIRRWRKIEKKRIEPTEQVSQSHTTARRLRKEANRGVKEQDDLPNKIDSMPLKDRLKSTPAEQEPFLQSQPISPTKLKVTRQSKLLQTLPKAEPVVEPPPPPPVEEISLKWSSYQSNMQCMFPSLLSKEQYVDATLVAEGQSIKCHRVILSSCSSYFEETLSGISPFQHPVIFMKDVPFWILKTLCDFMYTGEVQILQTKLPELLAVAENLKIKGLEDNYPKEEVKAEPSKPIKEDNNEEVNVTKEKEPEKKEKKEPEKREVRERKEPERREVRERRKPVIPTNSIPLLKCERLKLIHNSEKALLKRLKVQFKNNKKKSAPPPKPVNKEPPREPLSKADILDPYDLLEPVYEEVQKEKIAPVSKAKESKSVPVKKSVAKKVKKRKISDDRDESPSPVLTKKGTRSRPIKKMAKYSEADTVSSSKEMEVLDSPIVREPHTSDADVLLAVEDIKTEPLEIVDDIIEIEDNVLGFSDNISIEEEEIVGSYDNILVNYDGDKNKRKSRKKSSTKASKDSAGVDSPVLMEVHGLMEKGEDILKIVDVAEIKDSERSEESRQSDLLEEDPLNITQGAESTITITNIQSLVETKEDSLESVCNEMGFQISEIRSQTKESIGKTTVETEEGILGFDTSHPEKAEETNDRIINSEPQTSEQSTELKGTDEDANVDTGQKNFEDNIDKESEKIEKPTTECDNDLDTEHLSSEEENVTVGKIDNIVYSDTIKVVDFGKLTDQSNQNESVDTCPELERFDVDNFERDTPMDTTRNDFECSDEDRNIQDSVNQNENVMVMEFETDKNEMDVPETNSKDCIELETEQTSNPQESADTFQYDLSEFPCVDNANEKNSCVQDNLDDEKRDSEDDYFEEITSSNSDSLKGCENAVSELGKVYSGEYENRDPVTISYTNSIDKQDVASCSQNIASFTSPSFHVVHVVSQQDDNYEYFKSDVESELTDCSHIESNVTENIYTEPNLATNSYVESNVTENDPMRSEIDTIVSDLTQIVGESQNSLSESNSDNLQEDIEESLANLLK